MPPNQHRSTQKRPRVGDLVEIRTRAGLGYVQYVARDRLLGPRLRVLAGVFVERPDLRAHASRKAAYHVHFPLGAAVSRGLVTLVGNEPVPTSLGAEADLFHIQEIWNVAALAERMAAGWTPA